MAYVTVDVDVDLGDMDDEDIIEEYESRGLGDGGFETKEKLTKIWLADREGRKDEAYALMREYVLDKLGKVV